LDCVQLAAAFPTASLLAVGSNHRKSKKPPMKEPAIQEWPHAPSHRFVPNATYMVTGSTYQKQRLFDTDVKRTQLMNLLFSEALRWKWSLQAWAIMSNHYHFIAHAPGDATTLARMIKALHSRAAIWLNDLDATRGRKVLFQYYDTCLTFERSYFARLHYVHHNPVKHGIVEAAENYPWCSMNWFQQNADPAFRKTVLSFKIDEVNVRDDY
jgi:putative transposase